MPFLSRLLRFARSSATLLVAGVVAACSSGGLYAAQDYLVHDWDLDEGLPSTCMNAITRTGDGYVWLGTQHGLVRFDGLRFVVFNTENTPEIKDNRIASLALDPRGGFWAATVTGGVVRNDRLRFSVLELGAASKGRRINSMAADAAGNLWLATTGSGLLQVKNGQVKVFTTTNGLPSLDVLQVLADSQGRVWYLANPGRLGWVDGEQCRELAGTIPPTIPLRVMTPARGGGLWLAAVDTQNAGTRIFKLKDDLLQEETQSYPWPQTSERARPGALLEDAVGNLWCGTSGGGMYLRSPDSEWRAMVKELPMSQAEVLCLLPDEGESVWIGTRTSGLHHSVPRPLGTLHLPPAHNQSVLLTVCVRHDGSVWGGTDGAGVFRWENVQGMRPAEQVGLSGAQVYALLEDSRSNLWAGASTGLFQFRNGRFEQVAGAPLARRVTALYEDRAGKLWAGTARGLIGFGGATPVSFNQRSGLPTGQIMAVTRDQADRFWVAVAGRGLFHEEGGQFKLWTSGNGEPAPPSRWSDGRYSRSLLPDRDGSIWIGTYGYGLFRIDGGRLRWWSWQFDGLPSNHILDLQADDAGNLWCSSENGIFGYAKKTLLDYLGAGSPRPIPLRLTKAEGLPYKVCSGGGQPTGAKTRDGRLWFPNAAALVSFDPAAAPRSQQTRPPLVEELRVDGLAQPITPGFPLRIMSGARSFEFVFTSPNMLTPTRLRFRYRLEGLDEDWALEGNQRSVKYSALTPGKYTFRVMARDSDEGWTGPEAALPLIIVPRWWELSSVRLAGGLILLGAIAVIARQGERARSRRKLAVVERERALERERARIARDIHDDLGASLTQVALLGDMAAGASGSPEEMRMQTRQISEAAHEMVQSLEAIVWAVRPENDTLRSLVEYMNRRTDELFEKMPRQYQFTAPAILPACSVHAEVRHNVFLAYKEALTNALKHAQASAVRIAVACDNSTCRITITDNGRGFDARIVRAGGTGLKNMRLRLEEIGGRAEVQSQPGQGTTARLEFSLSREGRA